MNLFFSIFYHPKLNACAGQKNNMCFSKARPKSNARAPLKQRKKHSGLTMLTKYLSIEQRETNYRDAHSMPVEYGTIICW